MSFSVGIVGLPNVGKSTLFSALTKKQVNIANYPFTTVDPNIGIVRVPDERLDKLSQIFESKKSFPTVIEFVDIAGLVKGAAQGEGLGNQFLSHIGEVDAIVHLVRLFVAEDVAHVDAQPQPINDIDTVNAELIIKDLETIQRRMAKNEREVRAQNKEAVAQHEILLELKKQLQQGRPAVLYLKEHEEAREFFAELQLLSAKPQLYCFNADTKDIPSDLKAKMKELVALYVVLGARDELEMGELSEKEIEELGMSSSIPELIKKTYAMLNLISFFTVVGEELRAWTTEKGTTVPQATAVIHSDFQDKFIRAAVIQWDKLLETGGLTEAMAQGLIRTEGKDYVVKDGDVIEVKHG